MDKIKSEYEEAYKDARDFAWNHFELHARQRIEMFKSYVAFIAVTYAAYGAALQAKAYWICASLCVLAILLSTIFSLFDARIRQLLKISERYLIDEEKRLSELLNNPNVRLFRKSDLITHALVSWFRITYSNLFKGVYIVNFVIAFVLIMFVILLSHF